MLRCVCVELCAKFASFGPLKACKDMMRVYSQNMRRVPRGIRLPIHSYSGDFLSPRTGYFLSYKPTNRPWYSPTVHSTSSGFHLCAGNELTISVNLEFGCRIRIRSTFRCHDHEMVLGNVQLYVCKIWSKRFKSYHRQDRCKGTLVYTNLRTGRVIHDTFNVETLFPRHLHLRPWCMEGPDMSLGVIRLGGKE